MELTSQSYRLLLEKLACFILAVLSLWFGIGDVGRGYGFFGDFFGALKLGLCILSGVICIRVFSKGIIGPAILCALIAVIYNPFVSLDLDFDSWRAVNIATAIGFAWVFWSLLRVSKLMTPEKICRMQLAEARAEAIDEAISKGEFDENIIKDYMKKLTAATSTTPQDTKAAPITEHAKDGDLISETLIHFVIKGPPPGVPRTKENNLITAKASRTIGPDGKHVNKISAYAGADPLTLVEANSAVYWRDQIERGCLSDVRIIDSLHTIGQHTPYNYIMVTRADPHPGEVAITFGLTQLSLHYAIAYLDQLGIPQSTKDWMTVQRAKGLSYDRVSDSKKADSLKAALLTIDLDPEFLSHVIRSVDPTKRHAQQAAPGQPATRPLSN